MTNGEDENQPTLDDVREQIEMAWSDAANLDEDLLGEERKVELGTHDVGCAG